MGRALITHVLLRKNVISVSSLMFMRGAARQLYSILNQPISSLEKRW